MATAVKDTPILLGKDAEAFDNAISDNFDKKVSHEEFYRAMLNFKLIRLIA